MTVWDCVTRLCDPRLAVNSGQARLSPPGFLARLYGAGVEGGLASQCLVLSEAQRGYWFVSVAQNSGLFVELTSSGTATQKGDVLRRVTPTSGRPLLYFKVEHS